MAKRVVGITFVLLLLAGIVQGTTLSKIFSFDAPLVSHTDAGTLIEIRGCRSYGNPGDPILPVCTACFLLPPGETALDVTISADGTTALGGSFDLAPAPASIPPGRRYPLQAEKNAAVYRSSEPYPARCGALVTEQVLSGARLAFINVYPCRAIPATGTVLFSPSVTVTIETGNAFGPDVPVTPPIIHRILGRIEHAVVNPEFIARYQGALPGGNLRSGGNDVIPYVIITSAGLRDAFQPFAELKTLQGLRTVIVDADSISSRYPGTDLQERIRNFIAYAYGSWQTEYVLLGGDDGIIPHRGLYAKVASEIETDIPSDLYYGALDGNWNTDGDAYFGEPGEEDMLAEVTVGRIPVDSPPQLSNYLSKLTAYVLCPADSLVTRSLMVGELLWSIEGENTWGGDYKDEIFFGTSNNGFTTAGIPASFDGAALYDRDLGFSWNKAHLVPLINSGVNIINHLGHTNLHSVMRLSLSDVQLIDNDGPDNLPFVCYSQGCYGAAFDNRDDAGTVHAEDAVSESLLTDTDGAVAFIGNTRLGWNAPGSTCGVSQFFDRQFFDAVFGEGITTIGRALDDSRLDNVPFVSYAAVRYVMYGLCLLGDPAMDIWTEIPKQLEVTHDSVIAIGQDAFTVEVRSEDQPVENARVSVHSEQLGIYQTSFTDCFGRTVIDATYQQSGEIALSVLAKNHTLYTGTVQVTQSAGALPVVTFVSIDDDSLGSSSGDGDHVIENGEVVEIGLIIKNEGATTVKNMSVSCTCSDQFASLTDGNCYIGDLPPRTSIIKDNAFVLEVATEIPDCHSIDLCMQINALEGQWSTQHAMTVIAPRIVLESWAVTDSLCGNGNGCIEPLEFHNVSCTWRNNGSIDIVSPVVTLSVPPGSWAKVNKRIVKSPSLPAGGTLTVSNELEFSMMGTTPPFSDVTFFISFSGQNTSSCVETLAVTTCGYEMDDPADDEGPWRHRSMTAIDEWHLSSEQSFSTPSSWKCGSDSNGTYANMMEAVLVSPPLCLYENSTLSFTHKMETEAGSLYPYWAEDAGVVEISTDGGETWQIISPVNNYPARASAANTIFLNPYQRCYAGTIDWKAEEFDLSAYHGPVQIRFHFASNEQYGFEGWYIDDIRILTERTTDIEDDPPYPQFVHAMMPAYPNPFNPRTVVPFQVGSRSPVVITVFDVSGRHVKTLLDRIYEAGRYSVSWNGTDRRGCKVTSGVYFCRLRIGPYCATQRLILIR